MLVGSCLNISCQSSSSIIETKSTTRLTDDELLTTVQLNTFQYFWDGAEPNSGLARERIHMNGIYPSDDKNIITTGGSGFGVMAILVGIERGFITREEGLVRFERIVHFLETCDRYHGVWSHWIDGETGKTKPFGREDNGGDLVETAFLIQGLLAVRQYYNTGSDREKKLASRIDKMWREVEWTWFQKDGENVLYWHWSPDFGWIKNHPVTGYNESLIMYILAASSPTHPIAPAVYHDGWAQKGQIKSNKAAFDLPMILDHKREDRGGPLFWAHYSYLGLNPHLISDQYADYWELNKNHTLMNYYHCVENPKHHYGYGEHCWGLTASYTNTGYGASSPNRDIGVIAPTAALSSMPYTPKKSLKACRYFYEELGDQLFGPYGFYDAFLLRVDYFPKRYLAIDQGPIVVMIENYRSQLLWDLFMSAPEINVGLKRLDFTIKNAE